MSNNISGQGELLLVRVSAFSTKLTNQLFFAITSQ